VNKFKRKYILAEGYPWIVTHNQREMIQMEEAAVGHQPVPINWPEELWSNELPKYRLVLERVKEKEADRG